MTALQGKISFISIIILLFSSAVWASAEDDFNRGNQFFRDGDYVSAVKYFKRAQRQGLDSVALQYNLASSYFKLEDYDNAEYYFKQVAKSAEMRELAEYNLGLIAVKQDEPDRAEQYFTAIVNTSKDKKIVALSKSQLDRLQQGGDRWRAFVLANVGYDDNITALPDDAVIDMSDSFYNVFLLVDAVVAGERKNGWLLDARYFTLDFSDTDFYDNSRYSLGLRREFTLADWENRVQLDATQHDFGGEDFQSGARLEVSGNTSITQSDKIYLRYIYEDLNSNNPIYDYLEGWRQRARFEYRAYASKSIKQIYYELELNSRGELVATGYSYEYSPTRHTVSGKYTRILSEQWQLIADLAYRASEFPESASMERTDKQWKLGLAADYLIDKTFKLKTGLKFIDNASTADQYDYDKTMLTIGVSKLF